METNLSTFNFDYRFDIHPLWKRRMLWLVALILLIFTGDRVGGVLLNELMLSSESRYSLLYAGKLSDKQVLFIGNSRGLHSFYQPEIESTLNTAAFNLSYNDLSTNVANALFKDYLALNEHPQTIVIEVSMLAYDGNSNAMFKPFALQSDNLARLLYQENPSNGMACRISHLYCFNSELFLRTLYYLGRSDQSWINRYQITPNMIEAIQQMKPRNHKIVPGNIAALKQMIQLAEKHNIQVKLILSPYYPAYADHIVNLDQWLTTIESKVGYPIANYTYAIDQEAGFADRLHLNEKGSRLFLDILIQDGFLE